MKKSLNTKKPLGTVKPSETVMPLDAKKEGDGKPIPPSPPKDPFEIGATITTGLGLLGFGLAVWLTWKLYESRNRLAQLKSLPEKERAGIVDDLLTRYGISGKGLSPDQRFLLIQEEMRRRHGYRTMFLVVVVGAAVICFAIAVFGRGSSLASAATNSSASTQ